MEYIILFLLVLAGKHFCSGLIDAVSLPGASAVPQAWRSQCAGIGGKKKWFCKGVGTFATFALCSVLDLEIE